MTFRPAENVRIDGHADGTIVATQWTDGELRYDVGMLDGRYFRDVDPDRMRSLGQRPLHRYVTVVLLDTPIVETTHGASRRAVRDGLAARYPDAAVLVCDVDDVSIGGAEWRLRDLLCHATTVA